ncbi:hypothetical protein AB4Z48_00605 [Cupriavidus sp. 2TAF22]|uniref:hypothetical protein n=1 Tax=unclassified Cupriavidus TaxID=2640874 RepID=UPI003F90C372
MSFGASSEVEETSRPRLRVHAFAAERLFRMPAIGFEIADGNGLCCSTEQEAPQDAEPGYRLSAFG